MGAEVAKVCQWHPVDRLPDQASGLDSLLWQHGGTLSSWVGGRCVVTVPQEPGPGLDPGRHAINQGRGSERMDE